MKYEIYLTDVPYGDNRFKSGYVVSSNELLTENELTALQETGEAVKLLRFKDKFEALEFAYKYFKPFRYIDFYAITE